MRRVIVVLIAYAAMGLMALVALNVSFLNPVSQVVKEFTLSDIYYQVLQESEHTDTSHVVTIVDMTDLPGRGAIAEALEAVNACEPKVVGIDVVFEGLKEDTLGDMRIMEAAMADTSQVFSFRLLDNSENGEEEIHSFFADIVPIHEGFTNFERSLYGGIKRQVSCGDGKRISLVAEVVNLYAGEQLFDNSKKKININFTPKVFRVIPPDSIAYYSDYIKDNVVLFGATHELSDMHYTPLGQIAGVELLAYSIQTLLEQSDVKVLPVWLTAILMFFVSWLTWVMLQSFVKWAKGRKNEVSRFLFTTTFLKGWILFMWMGFFLWIGFLLFSYFHVNVSFGWAFASFPFLSGANEFYDLCKKMFNK
jgi:CHASE2 domain-containing sensor protein